MDYLVLVIRFHHKAHFRWFSWSQNVL